MQRKILNLFKWGLVLALLAFAGYVDKVTGYEVSAFPLYSLPISLAVWYFGTWAGVSTAFACVIVWYWSDIATGHAYSEPWIIYVNGGSRFVFFLFVAITVGLMVSTLRRARARLSAFTETITVCHSCRTVRDHDGYWWEFTAYLREYGGATIQRKLCPDCARKTYADNVPSTPTDK